MGRIASLRAEVLWRFPDNNNNNNNFLLVFRFGDIWLGNRHKPIFLNLVPSQGLERDHGPNCVVAAAIVMAFPREKKQRFFADFPICDIWLGNRHKPIFLTLVPSQGLNRDNGPNCIVSAAIAMAFPSATSQLVLNQSQTS